MSLNGSEGHFSQRGQSGSSVSLLSHRILQVSETNTLVYNPYVYPYSQADGSWAFFAFNASVSQRPDGAKGQ